MDNISFISRRKFGQILIFSALTSVAGESLEKAVAKSGQSTTDHLIYGIVTIPGSNHLSLSTLNLKTGKTKILLSSIPKITLNSNERVTSFSRLSNQLFLIAIAPTIASPTANRPRLAIFSEKLNTAAQPKVLVPKLSSSDSIESVLNTEGSELLMLVRKTDQRHHAKPNLLSYDTNVKISGGAVIPAEQILPALRILSLSPNGEQLYGVSVHGASHHGGVTSLWKGNLQTHRFQKLTDLSFKKETWGAGFRSLICTATGRLYGLGSDDRNHDFNNVYELNPQTGEMNLISRFDVMNISI